MSAEKGHRIVHVPPDQIFGVSCEPRRWTDDAAMLLFWRRLNSMERVAIPPFQDPPRLPILINLICVVPAWLASYQVPDKACLHLRSEPLTIRDSVWQLGLAPCSVQTSYVLYRSPLIIIIIIILQ
jgi:hypothetical protein